MHVPAPAAIWSYVCACLSAGRGLHTIWTYVYACFSAGDHMELRVCMFERRRSYGVTFLYIAAPAIIWSYACACLSAGGGLNANKYEFACHMDLRLCILERRWPYGLTFLHARAPGGIRRRYGVTFLHV